MSCRPPLISVHSIFVCSVLLTCLSISQETSHSVATVTKTVGNVEFLSSSEQNWKVLTPEIPLMRGYELRTNKDSFLGITFADSSQLLVRESSMIAILGEAAQNGVRVRKGKFAFQTGNRDTAAFCIEWPSAVAFVRSAKGGFSLDPTTGKAVLSVGPGTARISSSKTNCSYFLEADKSATIDKNGCADPGTGQ